MSQKGKNPIWQFFEKNATEDASKAVCKICKKMYSLGSHEPKRQTVHGLKQHLSKFHDAEHKQLLQRQSEIEALKKEGKLKQMDCSGSMEVLNIDEPKLVQSTIPSLMSKSKPEQWPDDHEKYSNMYRKVSASDSANTDTEGSFSVSAENFDSAGHYCLATTSSSNEKPKSDPLQEVFLNTEFDKWHGVGMYLALQLRDLAQRNKKAANKLHAELVKKAMEAILEEDQLNS